MLSIACYVSQSYAPGASVAAPPTSARAAVRMNTADELPLRIPGFVPGYTWPYGTCDQRIEAEIIQDTFGSGGIHRHGKIELPDDVIHRFGFLANRLRQ